MNESAGSGSFGRIAELHLRRLARFALTLEEGGASRGAIAQQSAALRRFQLSAREAGQDAVADRITDLGRELAEPPGKAGPRSNVVHEILGALVEACRVTPVVPAVPRERRWSRREDDRQERAIDALSGPLEDLERLALEIDPARAQRLRATIRTLRTRLESLSLVPLAPVVDRVREMGERAARERSIAWARRGVGISVERRVASWLEGHLGQLVLNALQHGREVTAIWVDLAVVSGGLEVEVGDDGQGEDDPAFGVRALSAGGGLSHLAREVQERGGRLEISRAGAEGTRIRFRIPIDRARLSCLHVRAGGSLAFPSDRVLSLSAEEGVGGLDLDSLLWRRKAPGGVDRPVVVLDVAGEAIGVEVDEVGPSLETVVHPLALPGSPYVAAGIHDPQGGVGYLLDVEALGRSAHGER